MFFQLLADFDGTENRRLGIGPENQRPAVTGSVSEVICPPLGPYRIVPFSRNNDVLSVCNCSLCSLISNFQ